MKKKITAIMLVVMMISGFYTGTVSAASERWQSDNDMAQLLSGLNIMVGDDDGNFNFDNYVTRAEMAKIAVASSSYKNTVALGLQFSPFSDVKGTYWGAPYIRAAVSAGIVEGYIDGTFRPTGTVTYEEAITMMLRVLGYTETDFGASYPYGQIGTADGLRMTDGIEGQIGMPMTRRDIARLVCNSLDTKSKLTNQDLILVHDCQFIEDVTIIASGTDDKTLGSDEISTSAGKYRIDESFDDTYVGCKGDLVVKDGKYFIAFSSDEALKSDKYIVYSTLNDAILCYPDGNNTTIQQFRLSDSTTCYKDSVAYTYGTMRGQMEMGDVVRIRYRDNGEVDYISYSEGTLDGPIKVSSASWISSFDTNSQTKIVRDGKQVTKEKIQINDILYYSDSLNMILAYTQKVTGVYEDAIPSKDLPRSIVVSGVTYEVEGVDAFNDLSSNGSVNIGDTVTLLLGRDGEKVAGVATLNEASGSIVGYVTGAGRKDFAKGDGTTYSSYYIDVVTADGTAYTYPTDYDKKSSVNKVVKITINNGKAQVGSSVSATSVSGEVSYADMKIGTKKVSDNVVIIDVAKNVYSDVTLYTRTYMQRLDGMTLKSGSVLYTETDSNGEISAMIVQNATGDMYSYGIVTSVTKGTSDIPNTAIIMSDGISYTVTGMSGMSVGLPVKFVKNGNMADYATGLEAVSGTVNEFENGYAVIKNIRYLFSDKVQIYEKTGTQYRKISISDATDGNYSYTCYSDDVQNGRIRVVVVNKK
ncbi:MAG: S-layer homology domain-containing protein [Clostridia bacterium]|nr:S-layer homology domain-containing protein [Clostridia bacterium]